MKHLLGPCLLLLAPTLASAAVEATDLRCEYRVNPLGLDVARPRLSWLPTAEPAAWQVRVATSEARLAQPDLWDSGQVRGRQHDQLAYAGTPLAPRQHVWWQVRLWDAGGAPGPWSAPARWSQGLGAGDWQARWIGLDEPAVAAAPVGPLRLVRAFFGTADGRGADVTALLTARIEHDALRVPVRIEALGGDPLPGRRKQLTVDYTLAGVARQLVVDETGELVLNAPTTPDYPTPRQFRRTFRLERPPVRATLHATALGVYELTLNGRRVGDQVLAPEWTNYGKRVQVQTYDVTGLLTTGDNLLGALLGNGWYCGGWQFWQRQLKPIYGREPALLVQLELEHADGTRTVVASDESWSGTTAGPVRFAGIYEGETVDARRVPAPGDWRPAQLRTPVVGQLVWQRNEPIRVTQELRPVALTEPKPGVYVYDLGQNIAGWARLTVDEPAGTAVSLLFNEVLKPDGTVYLDNLHAGHLSPGRRQIDEYTCRGGGPETFEPHFTYHGFRYVEVRGLTHKPAADALVGRVCHSDMPPAGEFTCSNPALNRLAQNIAWSQRGNFMGVPTDCCQRDERCGYTGDANFFMGTAVYNFDVAAFFHKWLVDVCEDSQHPSGWFADHAPSYGPGPGPNVGWTDAGILCPYRIWRTYGDTRVLREHWPALQRHLAWQAATSHDGLRDKVGNGDWLNLGGGASATVIATAYWADDLRAMAEMADALGETAAAADYRAQYERVAAAFAARLLDADGRVVGSSQTGYALAFTAGLVPAARRALVAERFADEIARFKGHLATGFIGTPRLLPALHLAGRDDLAYQLLLRDDFPSWLFPVKQGATTVWERWDGWRPERGFQDSGMNSFNHYAFGAVGEYLFRVVAGIAEAEPGYRTLRLEPTPGPGLDWAEARYRSVAGPIECGWRRDGERIVVEVSVPPGVEATVRVPQADARVSGGNVLRREAGATWVAVKSGRWRFE